MLFEGAQGAMLDVDLGTYPFVTSSTTTRRRRRPRHRARARGASTRCSASSRPTPPAWAAARFRPSCSTSTASTCRSVGHEFGAVTGRRRRCGWFDAVALRRSIVHSSCSSLCVTKLDVLDGLDTIRVCVGYRIDGGDHLDAAAAVAISSATARRSTRSCRAGRRARWARPGYEELPPNARRYLERLQALVGRAHRHHLHRSRPRPDDIPQASLRLTARRRGGAVARRK